jgi:CubicO group peptidase (beta-lactamase class C family)
MRGLTILSKLGLVVALAALCPSLPAAPVPDGAIAAIDKIAAEGIDQRKVASYAVGVVKDGRIVLARGYGFADLENDVPATAETVYRLGSITKQFTAMAIMLLDEDDKLSVDDELTRFLPEYPTGGRKITVGHLLNHTSGIKSYTNSRDFFKRSRQDFEHGELLALFKDEPLDFEPGAKWRYSNSGYYLLGMIIEKASGQKYEQFLEQRIFKPLAMSATRYGHTQPLIRLRARGYDYFFGQLTNDDSISMDAPFAAGALVSTVLDLIKWHQALEDGALVSSASYEAMYRPTSLADGATRPYGYGWQLGELAGHRTIRHGGGINGFSTMIARYPDDRLGVIVLSNTASANTPAVADRIAKVMLGIEDKPPADKPAEGKPIIDEPIDAALVELLSGKYALGHAEVEVSATDGQLFARLKGRPQDRLKYQGGRDFVHANDAQLRITFAPKEGKAERLQLDGGNFRIMGKRLE